MIRCKIKCTKVEAIHRTTETNAVTNEKLSENVSFIAVYSDDPNSENKQWSQWTPCFQLTMTINNPAAFGKFQEGKEYYNDFTPATT